MSNFEVRVQKIFVQDHPNADKLEIGRVGSPAGEQVVVAKGRFNTEDLCAYIGENSVVPEWLLKHYGYWNEEKNIGMLGGKLGNRVKAVKLRGEFSLGIVLPVPSIGVPANMLDDEGADFFNELVGEKATAYVEEGDNVAEFLGVIKYEPPIPIAMAGEVYNGGQHIGVNYDIENIKKYPDIFVEGEEVQVTEKLHGTFCQVVVMPSVDRYHHTDHFIKDVDHEYAGYIAVGSKGMGAQGLFLKHNEKNKNNVYLKTVRPLFDILINYITANPKQPITICGEVFGAGVQKNYNYAQKQPSFRVFDVYIGERGTGYYLNDEELDVFCDQLNLTRVPMLHRGSYSRQQIVELTQHTKSVFDSTQTREGVVIKPCKERTHHDIGRVVLKSINEDYLLKTTGEEIN